MSIESPNPAVLIQENAALAWKKSHSADEVLTMFDKYLESRPSHVNGQNPTIAGIEIINSLARFAAEADGPDHSRLISEGISLLNKHNQRRDFRALAIIYYALDLCAKGLKSEGRAIARMLHKSEGKYLKDEPSLKELIDETLED